MHLKYSLTATYAAVDNAVSVARIANITVCLLICTVSIAVRSGLAASRGCTPYTVLSAAVDTSTIYQELQRQQC
jgi:hypothetical protein